MNGGGPAAIAVAVTANSVTGAMSLLGDCTFTTDLGTTTYDASGDEIILCGTEPAGATRSRFKLDPVGPATACTASVNDSAAQAVIESSTTFPTPAGGTLLSGHYTLVSTTRFELPDATTTELRRTVLDIDVNAGTVELSTIDDNAGTEDRAAMDFSTNGAVLTLTPTCPLTAAPGVDGYTVSGDQLSVFNSTDKVVTAFQRAP